MSESGEDNQSLLQSAEEVSEIFADSVSSLVLMLVALQEKNKPPKPEMQASIQSVAEQSTNIGNISKELAEEDYADFPEIQKEILDASGEVFDGADNLTSAAKNLKTSNLREGYQQLVDGCRLCGTNCIKLLQIVYGASFKKLANEQENLNKLAEQLNSQLFDEDPQKYADMAGDLCSCGLQISEDMKSQAEGEAVPSDKAEMNEIAENIQTLSNALLDAVNAYLEDPDNEALKEAVEKAKQDLLKEMEKAKTRVAKSHEIVKKQQEALNDQTATRNRQIDDTIKNAKPLVPKEEQIQRGLAVLDNLDKMGEAVFWNNPKDFVTAANENMQDVPKFVDGRIADARNENIPGGEERAKEIKECFSEFVEGGKTAFAEPENEEKKDAALSQYKTERAKIVEQLDQLGCKNVPEEPQIDDAIIEGDDEELEKRSEEAVKSLMKEKKDKVEKLKKEYQDLDAMEYAVENGDNNAFVTSAKPVISDVQSTAQLIGQEAVKEKDVKKKKVAEKMGEDLAPAVNDSKASLADKQNKEKKEKAKESIKKLKEDLEDALVAEGVSKKQAEKLLSEKPRQDEAIKELLSLKEEALELQESVANGNASATAKNAKETLLKTKEAVPKIKSKSKDPVVNAKADTLQKKLVPAINDSNQFIKDSKDEKKKEQAGKSVDEFISAIDDLLRECKATPEEMKVVTKEKPDSELVTKTKKTREKAKKAKDALIDGDMEELGDAMIELDEAQDEMLRKMAEEAKKSGRKEDIEDVKKAKEEYEDAFEAVKKAKKDPKDKEARQKAEEKLDKYTESLNEVLSKEGKGQTESDKQQKKVEDDLQKIQSGLENNDQEKVKEGSSKLQKDMDKLKKEKEKDGQNVDQLTQLVKEAQNDTIASARDAKNAEKKKKALDSIKKCKENLSGEDKKEKVSEEEKAGKELAKSAQKTKGAISKTKMAMYDDDPTELADAMIELEENEKEMVEKMKEDARKSGRKHTDELKKADTELAEALEAIRKAKQTGKAEDMKEAEEKLEKLDSTCDSVLVDCGKPTKEAGKKARKVKEATKKTQTAYEDRDADAYNKNNKEMVKDASDLVKELEKDGQGKKAKEINDCVVECVKTMNDGYQDKEKKKDKDVNEKFEKLRDKLDDVLLKNGEPISDVSKGKDKEVCKASREVKKDCDKTKNAMDQEDAVLIEEELEDLKKDNEKFVKSLKESPSTKENVKLQDLLKRAEVLTQESEEAVRKVKEHPEDKKAKKNAEKKLDELESCCNEVLKEEGKPVKESAKHSKKLKEKLHKMDEAVLKNDKDAYEEAKKDALEEEKIVKQLMEKDKTKEKDALAKELDETVKASVEECDGYFKDPENKAKKEKARKSVEKAMEKCDEAIVANGENLTVKAKDKRDEEVLNDVKKVKNDTTKAKEGLYENNDQITNDAMKSMKEDSEDLIKALESSDSHGDNKQAKELAEKVKKAHKEAEEKVKAAQKSKDPKSIAEAEAALDELNETCNDIRQEYDRPTKEGSRQGQKAKEKISKVESALSKKDPKAVDQAVKELKKVKDDLKKALEEEGLQENDAEKKKMAQECYDDIQKFIDEVNKAKSDPSKVESAREKAERAKKTIDKVLVKEGEPSFGNQNMEGMKALKDLEDMTEAIILNDEEEAHLLIEDMVKSQRKLTEAMQEGNEDGVKDALEELEKKKKMKDEVINKAIERCPAGDREILKKANEEMDKKAKENADLAEKALKDKKLKDRAKESQKITGESCKIAEPMKALLTKPNEIKAEEASNALAQDCKAAEKLAKEPNEKKIKDLRKKLAKDTETYEESVTQMLENADLTPEEQEKLKKELEDVKKKSKDLDEKLEKLAKNKDDKKAKDDVEKASKDLDKALAKMNDDFDVKQKSKCKKAQKKLNKCKEACILKDKEGGETALAELTQEEEELMKSIDEKISKESNAAKKKELEEQKKATHDSVEEAKKQIKNALDTGDDGDIIISQIACEGANADLEKLKEKLKGGKTKINKKHSAADRMKYVASARSAMKNKNFKLARENLENLKKMLKEQLDDPNLDEETRQEIEELLKKVDFALDNIENAEELGLMDEISEMTAHLNDLTGGDLTEQAKAKAKGRGIVARAKAGKRANLNNLIKGSKDLADKMKGLKMDVKDEAHDNMDGLSDAAKAALHLDDMLDDMSNGIDLDGVLGDMKVEDEPEVEAPKNSLQSELNGVADMIKQTTMEESKPKATGRTKQVAQFEVPTICGDIAIHFKELAKNAANANKEGIIVEGRTISSAITQFCKELAKAQPICKDRRTADDMALSLQTLKNLSTQLKILCSVKAATVGNGDMDADDQLISLCKNIGTNMKNGIETLAVANRTKMLK
ncbi:axoneme-associated protein mst101, putative [Entamoeba invadens IP1]|uniref:Axoneme-associated protein mst101, putative n=1 Tax=Entamoeba invadens IP1 TaxID=370355 RepID=A0A0A1U553_ENTIV|nr:axoneme-associated protein mst101, putative [Entamoeba invadens IP1]ELP86871.1 axoneme-associated protein mst101, putative [Entamoeba invadens IP1]|eukprot:XP_004253642.1 axoneme-associated protein mst101, putative [Entamoeba invadens IP1]